MFASAALAASPVTQILKDRMRRFPAVFAVLVAFAALSVGSAGAEDLATRLAGLGQSAADPLAAINAELGSPVKVEAVIEPGSGGKPDVVAITARLEEGWHLYSITQKPGGPLATRISVAADSARQTAGPFEPNTPPHRRSIDDVPAWKGLVVEEHEGSVTWRAPLSPGGSGPAELRGTVSVQLCRDGACLPPETIAFTAAPGTATPVSTGPVGGAAGPAGGAAGAAGRTSHAPERTHAAISGSFRSPRSVPNAAGRRAWPLVIEIEPEVGWHVYRAASTAATEIGKGKPTIVAVVDAGENAGVAAHVVSATVTKAVAPESAALATTGAVEGPVVLELLVEPADGAADEKAPSAIDLVLGFQTCSETSCDPPAGVRMAVRLSGGEDPAAAMIEFSEARYAEAAAAPLAIAAVEPVAGGPSNPPSAAPSSTAISAASPASVAAVAAPKPLTLPVAMLMGLAGGLILNLMPCVLPVLGLKLMSFAQQSGQARREVFESNLWYCAGLFAVFFVLATASVAANIGLGRTNLAWGEQFTSARFNIAMVGIVFAFALSFLGTWELPIPGFIGEQAGHVQSREGPMGAFLKGVLSTVLATPCSGPFLGPVFGYTLTQPTVVTYAVFGAIATGMALPYILVGLFPALVRFLPKPGGWMATFKELLGFVMLGTVVYLFTFLHHDWFVPTLAMLVGIWAACWWVGRAQERLGGAVGFGRWVQAAAVATAIGTAAFMFLGPVKSVIEWEQPFSRARLAELRGHGATVMIDFSADWCPTCKFNLATAIETNRVRAAVQKNGVVPLLADWTDGSLEIKQMLESLHSKSIPVLAIFPAGKPGQPAPEPIVLRDLITESQVLEALERAGPSSAPPPEIRAASAAAVSGGR